VKRPARYFPNSDLQQLTQVLVTRRRTVLVFVARTNTFSVRGASDDSRQLEPGDSAESAGARRREHMADFSTKSLASDGQKKTARGCSPADAESARPSTKPSAVYTDPAKHRTAAPSHWGAAPDRQAGECQGPGQSVMRRRGRGRRTRKEKEQQ
jgi:hypothetical protein